LENKIATASHSGRHCGKMLQHICVGFLILPHSERECEKKKRKVGIERREEGRSNSRGYISCG